MKKLRVLSCIALLSVIPVVACGKNAEDKAISKTKAIQSPYSMQQILEEQKNQANSESSDTATDPSVDVDLTSLSATMVYSEVYQMMYYPENYVGKSIKMDGLYDHYHDDNSGNDYYACIIQDATACCAQGIEFKLSDGNYPADTQDYVSVKGTFTTYEENGTTYCTLVNAELVN